MPLTLQLFLDLFNLVSQLLQKRRSSAEILEVR